MTAAELVRLIDRTGLLHTAEGLSVKVRIIDAKTAYGVTRVIVTPVSGSGLATVNLSRIALTDPGHTYAT